MLVGIIQLVQFFHFHQCGQRFEIPRHPMNICIIPYPQSLLKKKKKSMGSSSLSLNGYNEYFVFSWKAQFVDLQIQDKH